MTHRPELLELTHRINRVQHTLAMMLAHDSLYDAKNVTADLQLAIARLSNLTKKEAK
jgi:hypothetical protein